MCSGTSKDAVSFEEGALMARLHLLWLNALELGLGLTPVWRPGLAQSVQTHCSDALQTAFAVQVRVSLPGSYC